MLVIVVVSGSLRFWNIDEIGLGGDESVYSAQALLLAGDEELNRFFVLVSRGSSNFLFHQTIQALVFAIVGFSDFSARFVSAIFSLATCILVFFLGREMYGKWTGILAALFISINGYAIAVGRVALLDSTMTFFFTLSMFLLYKWIETEQSKWAYLLAAFSGIAILAKVPAFVIIPIALLTILACRKYRLLSIQTMTRSSLILAVSLIPAFIQLYLNVDMVISFFTESFSRLISVPPTFYLDKMVSYSGILFVAATVVGVIISLIYRKKADLQCLIWLTIVALYFQFNPTKGWNYILPLIPVSAIFAGRGLIRLLSFLKPLIYRKDKFGLAFLIKSSVGILSVLLLLSASYYEIYHSLYYIFYNRAFVGLKEAAYWLKDNAPAGAGAITESHGSAQYVLSLYGNINSYPFGSFRLHTILPGGSAIPGAPPPDPLIQNGTVSYFVHYVSNTDAGDDPIHMENKTVTQSNFIKLLQKYQSHLRYTYYDEYQGLNGENRREPRVWIYETGKRLPEPQLTIQQNNTDGLVNLTGKGFMIKAYVNIYHDRSFIKQLPTDEEGSFTGSVDIPVDSKCGQLTVIDYRDNRVSAPLECR